MQQLILAKCISGVRIQYSYRYSHPEKKMVLSFFLKKRAKKRVGVCAAIFYVLEVIHMEVGVPTPGFAHLLPAIKDLESCRNQVGGVVRVEQMISSLD